MFARLTALSHRCVAWAATAALVALASCSNKEAGAQKAVRDYLKNHGVQELKVDLFCTDPGLPDQAYISVTVTYNFATADGKPQKEYLGYIVKQSGEAWAVQQNTQYTKDRKAALRYLSGSKGVSTAAPGLPGYRAHRSSSL